MEKNIKLTPNDLFYIITEMNKIKDKLRDTSNELKLQATNISSIWNDSQSERFLDNISSILQRLNARMEEVETEKNRLEEYQKRTDKAAKDAQRN
jgi:hypothetical protein